VNEMSRNNGVLPYFLDNPCALIIGGKFLRSLQYLVYPATVRAHGNTKKVVRPILKWLTTMMP
jgi:hypothetical protein